jgi:hypothetical protein
MPIVIEHTDASTLDTVESIKSLNKLIDPNNIAIEEFNSSHVYNRRNTFQANDLILDYAERKMGLYSLDDSASYEDILFMKYPELYAVAYFINRNNDPVFKDNDSYVIGNAIQYNMVNNASYQSKFIGDAVSIYGSVYVNFMAFESCDLKAHMGAVQSDKAHLDRMITKIFSGLLFNKLSIESNNNNNSHDTTVVRLHAGAGVNDCTQNKTFQFLIELLVCTILDYRLCYCVKNFDHLTELNDTMEAIGIMSVSELYFKLINYKFDTNGPVNFTRNIAYDND